SSIRAATPRSPPRRRCPGSPQQRWPGRVRPVPLPVCPCWSRPRRGTFCAAGRACIRHEGPGAAAARRRSHRRLAGPARPPARCRGRGAAGEHAMTGAEAGPLAGAQATEEAPALVDVRDVTRTFGSGRAAAHALRGVSLTVRRDQLTALCGRSGSGKTTLLNIIGGLDVPTGGSVGVAGREVTRMSERERMELRRDTIAFIFQSFGLIPML